MTAPAQPSPPSSPTSKATKGWFDNPRNVNTLIWLLTLVAIGLLISDAVYIKHGHFPWESWFGFFTGFGFISYIGLVLLTQPLRKLLKRKEDYYD